MAIGLMGAALGGGLLSGGLSAWGANKGAEEMADALERATQLQEEQMRPCSSAVHPLCHRWP